MRDSHKNLFHHQVTLEDGSLFYYTIQPFELTNALGNIIAVLQEYNFTKKDNTNGAFSFKLYKTKEENWYDIEEAKINTDSTIIRALKSAIDNQNITSRSV